MADGAKASTRRVDNQAVWLPDVNQSTQASSKAWRLRSNLEMAFIHGSSAHGVRDPHGGRGFNAPGTGGLVL